MFIDFFGSQGVLLHFHESFLSEFGIVVHIEFSVDAEKFIIGVGGPRVNFKLHQVEFIEHLVKISELFFSLVSYGIEFKFFDDIV